MPYGGGLRAFAPRLGTARLLCKRADRGLVLRLSGFVRGATVGLLRIGFWLLVVSFGHESPSFRACGAGFVRFRNGYTRAAVMAAQEIYNGASTWRTAMTDVPTWVTA
jgi:hypothetical protein